MFMSFLITTRIIIFSSIYVCFSLALVEFNFMRIVVVFLVRFFLFWSLQNIKNNLTLRKFRFVGGQFSSIVGFFLFARMLFLDAAVFSFSMEANSFLICFHRGCKFLGEGYPEDYHENGIIMNSNYSTVIFNKTIRRI